MTSDAPCCKRQPVAPVSSAPPAVAGGRSKLRMSPGEFARKLTAIDATQLVIELIAEKLGAERGAALHAITARFAKRIRTRLNARRRAPPTG